MRKVTVSRMRERYAQTVLTFRITYVNSVVDCHPSDIRPYFRRRLLGQTSGCLDNKPVHRAAQKSRDTVYNVLPLMPNDSRAAVHKNVIF